MSDLNNIPAELINLNRWLLWMPTTRANGKTGKKPYSAQTEKPARINNPGDFAQFSICESVLRKNHEKYGGLGLALGAGIVGIDLDDCVDTDGRLSDEADFALRSINSYAEYSPSRKGIHILFFWKIYDGSCLRMDRNRKNNVEVYTDRRFFTVTGDVIDGYNQIKTFTECNTVNHWLDAVGLCDPVPTSRYYKESQTGNDAKFLALMRGDTSGYDSQSAADFALCLKLAFYCGGDSAAIDQQFRQSGLMRDKWEERRGTKTYGQRTIDNALKQWDGKKAQPGKTQGGVPVAKREQQDPDMETVIRSKDSKPEQSVLGGHLARQLTDIAYDSVREDWMQYRDQHWQKINRSEALRLINQHVNNEIGNIGYSASYLSGVVAFVQMLRSHSEWDTECGLPFRNGLLILSERKLIPHNRQHRTTWLIPYDYSTSDKCLSIQNWLSDCVGGHADQVQLLRAYMAAILRGRVDLQRYLELIGPGGTGKGTFIRLCEMLIGDANCHSTELKHLENNRFETANLYKKRLITITDSQNYAGDVSVLKALTGQDMLRYEEKNKQGGTGFKASGMVIIAANEPIASKDYTSGIARRRITISFNNQVHSTQRRDLIAEFSPLVPGLINWLLDLSPETITALVRDTAVTVNSLSGTERTNLIAINPIAQWLDDCVTYLPGARCSIGILQRANGNVLDADSKLYPSYVSFCESSGTKALAMNRFVNLLEELCRSQLGLDVRRERDRTGRYFVGLGIKTGDSCISPLDKKYPTNPEKPVTLSTMRVQTRHTPVTSRHVKHHAGLEKYPPPL